MCPIRSVLRPSMILEQHPSDRRLILKIARRLVVLGLALMTALALVAPAFAQGADQAQVRVAHLAPDAPNVDVYVNGDPVLTDVPYTTSPVIDVPVELAAGGAYTVAAVGLVADGSLSAQVYEDDLRSPASANAKVRIIHASPDAGPVDVVPRGGQALVAGLTFPEASPYAEVPAGTYTLDVNAAGTNQTALTVPDATLASGGVYSAFAVGTVFADSLNVLLVQDNAAGTGAAASATASASAAASPASSTATPSASASASATSSATSSASIEKLPESGGVGTWVALPATLALLMGCGIGTIILVRRSFT